MKIATKHALALSLLVFLMVVPAAVAAGGQSDVGIRATGEMDELVGTILTEGADALFANIDEAGQPLVIYGRAGVPTSVIDFSDPAFDNCIAFGVVSARGEIVKILAEQLGAASQGGGMLAPVPDSLVAQQFGGDQGFSEGPDLSFLLGDEFSILAALYLNVDSATAQQRMSALMSQMTSVFNYQFAYIYSIRIDQSTIPPDANITLPFDSLDVFLYQVLNPFSETAQSILDVLGQDGLGSSVDVSKFSEARSAAAGFLAVPDLAYLVDFVNSTFGGMAANGGFTTASAPDTASLLMQQLPPLEGPVAIGAIGYYDDQVLSSSDTSVGMASLIGATGSLTARPEGLSVVMMHVPESVNISSVLPQEENYTYFDNTTNIVVWNATHYGSVPDYKIYFGSTEFPPLITIERTFSPETTTPGGEVQVTVTVTNDGDQPVTDVAVSDWGIQDTYDTITVTGTRNATAATLNPGESVSYTYTVHFVNEGTYAFPPVVLQYEYAGRAYSKHIPEEGYTVTNPPANVLSQAISDGMPYTGAAVGLVALGAIVQIAKFAGRRD